MKDSEVHEKYGKSTRVAFRISQTAHDRLDQVADVFQLDPAQCAKAILYMHLGVFEPIDNRRRNWRDGTKPKRR